MSPDPGVVAQGKMLKVAEPQSNRAGGLSEEEIVDRIFESIIEQRLPPGTKLSESALCEAFGVGRMRIRHCLLLLASRDIVDLRSNRGAYVSSPTAKQAREVFEARRAVEPNICRIVVKRITRRDILRLEQHLGEENAALRAGDRRRAIRLSGLFHVDLAGIADNHVLERMIKELVTRTSLILGIFGAPGTTHCLADEHQQLLEAFRSGKGDEAADLMVRHLQHIEGQVDLSARNEKAVNLRELFGQAQ